MIEEITKNISYILKFSDSARFLKSLLSNSVNILSEGLHRTKCKLWHGEIYKYKCEICGIKYKYCDCFVEYANLKDDLNRIQV